MTFNPTVLLGCNIYLDGADLTGFSNKAEFGATANKLTRTTFGDSGSNTYVGGLFDGKADCDGFFQAGDLSMPDDAWWNALSSPNIALTMLSASTGAAGDLAYLTRGQVTSYQPGAKVGELLAWSSSMATNWPDVRGKILHPQGTARTASGNGTGVQLGAVSASQRMYANLHVLSISGTSTPTITVTVQSDTSNAFSAPNTRISFNAATALGGQTGSALGAITDTWWRVTWTITGATPSFLFAVSAGIGPK
jgi:hypothetical protein